MFVEGVIVKEGNWWWIERWVSSSWYGTVAKLRRRKKGSQCTVERWKTTSKIEVNIKYVNHLLNLTV